MRLAKTIGIVFICWLLIAWRVLAFTAGTAGVGAFLKSASTTYVNQYSVAGSIGNLMVIIIASDNIGTGDGDVGDVLSVVDDAGNTFSKAIEFANGQGGASNGATISIWYCKLTNTVTQFSTQWTATFNGSVTAKAAVMRAFTFTSGNDVAYQTAQGLANDNADAGSITLSGLPSKEYLIVRACAIENNTSSPGTPETNFSGVGSNTIVGTSGGGAASNMYLYAEYRIVTTTSQATDPTTGAADIASAAVAFYEYTPAAVTRRRYIISKK